MNCRDFRELLDSYLSDELLTETNHDILRHLEECEGCRSEIEARRMVRTRLRTAVRLSPEFEMTSGFETRLRSAVRRDAGAGTGKAGWFGLGNAWAAVAAAFLIVASIGSIALLRGTGPRTPVAQRVIKLSSLPPNALVKMAASDHENCAVKHFRSGPPTTVAKVAEQYRMLARVVSNGLKEKIKDCDLVDSHSCGFKDVTFSHVVMRQGGKMLSVLISGSKPDPDAVAGKIARYSSPRFSISRFDIGNRTVFVISQMDSEHNAEAAEALTAPLKVLFANPKDDRPIQTALLMAR